MVITSNGFLGKSGRPSGYWGEELAAPYRVFEKAGLEIVLASPAGGEPPLDPMSLGQYETDVVKTFRADPIARARVAKTARLADVAERSFDGIFVVGGFGVMWDVVGDPTLQRLVVRHLGAGRPVAAVCHAPALLANTKVNEASVLAGRAATGFSDAEEEAVSLGVERPYVESLLRAAGARYEKSGSVFAPHVVRDGLLLTGQNPASSEELATMLVQAVGKAAS